jgi:large subunit ribosomal protein L13e
LNDPKVIKPRSKVGDKRIGRGFSVSELRMAGLTIDKARELGLYVDRRRRSAHPWNVEYLRKLVSG